MQYLPVLYTLSGMMHNVTVSNIYLVFGEARDFAWIKRELNA